MCDCYGRAVDRLASILRSLDLTSLAGDESPDAISALCAGAVSPATGSPSVAAVCVLPAFVAACRERLEGSGVRVACATGAFPSGELPTSERVEQITRAVEAGAQEIDTVMDHGAVRGGRDLDAAEQLRASRDACGDLTMKVILETGAAPALPFVRRTATLAIEAGADFLKTSTGKGFPGATPEAVAAMCEAIADADRPVGVKVSGGVKTVAEALGYLDLVTTQLGGDWADPTRFRIGASGLLSDLVEHLREERSQVPPS